MHIVMSKKYSVIVTALFLSVLFGFGIFHILLPDKVFSEQENRNLAQMKPITFGTVFSGTFMEDMEEYVTDQFPLRDQWVSGKALSEKLLGKSENNEVYFGTDGETLFAQYTAPSDEEIKEKVGYVNQLGENLSIPVYFAIIPDKTYVISELLPKYAYRIDDGTTLQQAAGFCSDKVTWIDLRDALTGQDSFYRTDHHWTTSGAYEGYQKIADTLSGTVTEQKGELIKVSEDFYGTTWSAAGAVWVKPDVIEILIPEDGFAVTSYRTGEPVLSQLYVESYLDKKDQYSMFLGGNQPLCVIQNQKDTQKDKLLVIRDSFADSLAPFLAQDYSEVHLLDLRYYRGSVLSYIEENDIDTVLVIYSNADFATDENLFLMTQ